MRELARLMELRCAATDALRAMPGAVALYAFGSLAMGTADRYSDLDLELSTTDLEVSLRARHAIFARIAPPALEWRIDPSRSDWAATLLFEDISPYHRIDIGFSVAHGGYMPGPEGRVLLWQQEPRQDLPRGNAAPPYMPRAGTPEHWVVGQLLGATRYVKARKRNMDLTCWRFASALANAVVAMVHAQHAGIPLPSNGKLSTLDWQALDGVLPEAPRSHLLSLLDFSTPERMDLAVHGLLQLLVRDAPVPGHLVDRLLAFVGEELSLSDQSRR